MWRVKTLQKIKGQWITSTVKSQEFNMNSRNTSTFLSQQFSVFILNLATLQLYVKSMALDGSSIFHRVIIMTCHWQDVITKDCFIYSYYQFFMNYGVYNILVLPHKVIVNIGVKIHPFRWTCFVSSLDISVNIIFQVTSLQLWQHLAGIGAKYDVDHR